MAKVSSYMLVKHTNSSMWSIGYFSPTGDGKLVKKVSCAPSKKDAIDLFLADGCLSIDSIVNLKEFDERVEEEKGND